MWTNFPANKLLCSAFYLAQSSVRTRGALTAAGIKKCQFEHNATFIYPENYYFEKERHDQNRFLSCIVCQKILQRKDWRKARKNCRILCVLESSELLEKVKHAFPKYDEEHKALSLSVCTACQNNKLPKRPKRIHTVPGEGPLPLAPNKKYPITESQREELESRLERPYCTEENPNRQDCTLCANIPIPPHERSENDPSPVPPPPAPPPKAWPEGIKPNTRKLSPGDKRFNRASRGPSTPVSLTREDLLANRSVTKCSSNAVGRYADTQRKRANEGLSPVTAPSGAVTKKSDTHLNKAFRGDYKCVKCSEGSEGFAVIAQDPAELIRKITWICEKDVRVRFVKIIYSRDLSSLSFESTCPFFSLVHPGAVSSEIEAWLVLLTGGVLDVIQRFHTKN